MSKVINMRAVKVQPFIVPSRNSQPAKVKPSIKLLGDWLRFAGFKPGTMATIIINNGVLTIRPEQEVKAWKE
jgi:hypothetical protein